MRGCLLLCLLSGVPPVLHAQCKLALYYAKPAHVTVSPIGLHGTGGVLSLGPDGSQGIAIQVTGWCGSDTNAQVKFELDPSIGPGNGLIVSPSSGTTPLTVAVGADLRTAANRPPGTALVALGFTTVYQDPPVTTTALIRIVTLASGPVQIRSVGNAASGEPLVTPGAVVAVRGVNIGPNQVAALDKTGVYPKQLGSTTVTFNGIEAPLLSSSATTVFAVAPYALAGQSEAEVVVRHYPGSDAELVSEPFLVPVVEASLGIFTNAKTGDWRNQVLNCDNEGCSPNSEDNPAPPGSIILFYATGMPSWDGPGVDGAVPMTVRRYSPVGLTVGGEPAQVLYAGSAKYQVFGILEVKARIPEGIGSGPQPIVLTLGEHSTANQSVTVEVK